MLFKKDKIEFFSLMPDVTRTAPILSATNFKPDLVKNSTQELSEKKKENLFGHVKSLFTAKCPGIYNYAKHGWVLTTWQDIVITTNGDGDSFQWTSALDQKNLKGGNLVGDAVSFHNTNQYSNYIENDSNTLSTVIKINTPWRCVVPKGYYLQEAPLPYSDEKRFTTVIGFHSQEYGVSPLNIQLLWHVMNGETLIKAGTPIAHYLLIPQKQPKLIVRNATKKDLEFEEATHIELNRKFLSSRTESKCIFADLFK
jgi:hypothetical protein